MTAVVEVGSRGIRRTIASLIAEGCVTYLDSITPGIAGELVMSSAEAEVGFWEEVRLTALQLSSTFDFIGGLFAGWEVTGEAGPPLELLELVALLQETYADLRQVKSAPAAQAKVLPSRVALLELLESPSSRLWLAGGER